MKEVEQTRRSEVPELVRQRARWIMGVGRMVHEPSRLAILTILRDLGRVEYLSLKECVRLSKGNLSNHLAKLGEAGLVMVEKHFEGKKPVMTVILTGKGTEVMEAYWSNMKRIGEGSLHASPPTGVSVAQSQQAIRKLEDS